MNELERWFWWNLTKILEDVDEKYLEDRVFLWMKAAKPLLNKGGKAAGKKALEKERQRVTLWMEEKEADERRNQKR